MRCRLPLDRPPRLHHVAVERPAPGSKAYRLPDCWSLLLFHYPMAAAFDGEAVAIVAGSCALLPPGVEKVYHHQGRGLRHHVVHFTCRAPREGDPELPWLWRLEEAYESLTAACNRLLHAYPTAPAAASAHLWDLLWRLAEQVTASGPPALVAAAQRRIEARLADRDLSVAGLATELQVSHGHLCSRFKEATGQSPLAWIRRRRAERAAHLLQHSTLPVARIAEQVGLRDCQSVNKLCRAVCGRNPRSLRDGR